MEGNTKDFEYNSMPKPTDQQMSMLDASEAVRRQYVRFNFQLYIEMGEQLVKSNNHKKRLQNIRKELEHLKSTDWQYESIEKHIGQA